VGGAVPGAVAHLRDAAQAQRRGHEGHRLRPFAMRGSDEQRKANRRLGLILASVALAFALGFMAKMVLLGG